jgi:UPF0271 protein
MGGIVIMHCIDLNSDLGESFGTYVLGRDEEVLESITSANVACGYHAGDPQVMQRTVAAAKARGVAVGAHPGYPDLQGFGRRTLGCTPWEAYAFCLYQIGALQAFCAAQGMELQHVKPHGALYNQGAENPDLARALVEAVRDASASRKKPLIFMGLAGSAYEKTAAACSLPFAAEAFADRAYTDEGTLVNRREPGAVLHDPQIISERILEMVTKGTVETITGKRISLKPASICVHGDTPEAVAIAAKLRTHLEARGIALKPLQEVLGI